jgi:Tol biopolymer transport system component
MRRRFALTAIVAAAGTCAWGEAAPGAPLAANGRIAFTSFSRGHLTVYSVRPDGQDRRRLSDATADGDPSWAPDGKHLVFARQRGPFDLFVMNAAGGDEHRAAKMRGQQTQPAWSPDGTKVAFVRQARGAQRSDICVFDFRDRSVRCATRRSTAFTTVSGPTWSPDGKRLAFAASRGSEPRGIYVVNVDGSGLRRLTRGSALDDSPAWSPDGARIAFASAKARSPFPLNLADELYVMNADGSHRRRLTRNSTFDGFPTWSPDGRRLAFSRFASSAPGKPITLDIFTMNASGGDEQRVTATASAHESQATWQPVAPPAPGG